MAAQQVNVGAMVLALNADTVQLEASIQTSESLLQQFAKTMEDVSNYTNSWTVHAQKISILTVGLKNLYGFIKGIVQGAIAAFMATLAIVPVAGVVAEMGAMVAVAEGI
ncbi:MAG: hypothetical protein Q4E67_02530 [Planctomycetia bacterium]|nr:hypothetical protein [Planctomycetia bacterium]